MSHSVPNWNVEDEPASFQDLIPSDTENSTVGPQHELMELLWKDGHLVMQSQIQPKFPSIVKDPKQVQKPESAPQFAVPFTDPDGLIQEDETPSWFQYPLDDALEKDFSEFFSGLPTSDASSADDKIDLMPPPKTHVTCSHQLHAEPVNTDSCDVSSDRKEDLHPKSVVDGSNDRLQHEKIQTEGHEGGITSSSCISGTSLGREVQYCDTNKGHKRKSGEGEDSKLQREETEYETLNTNKAAQRSTNARRSRAAEVHNLSERKRRDRINKKMKQLQELVPNCNKSDKASMLDEVIEYVKSLQIQVQLMWMRCRMFSGFQHYMTQMGIGTSYSSMFPAHNPSQLPVLPLLNPSTPAAFGPLSFPNQMRNLHTSAQCVHYLGFQPMQPPPQAIHAYPFSSRIAHRN